LSEKNTNQKTKHGSDEKWKRSKLPADFFHNGILYLFARCELS
jgi:CMP-N-acetylneuraminic acid synthetase